jgi:hypothetical protein
MIPLGSCGVSRGWRRSTDARIMSLAAVSLISVVLGGCGEISSQKPSAVPTAFGAKPLALRYPHEFVASGVHVLARIPLKGGYMTFGWRTYSYLRIPYFQLTRTVERQGTHGREVAGGGAISIILNKSGTIQIPIQIHHGCLGPRAYSVAYGVLGSSTDAAIAKSPEGEVVFKKVRVKGLRASGVLVYSVIGNGPDHVVTKAANGTVVSTFSSSSAYATCQ